MAIAYQTISTVATKTTTSNNSLTLNAPTGATTDDLLVACISFRGATTPSIPDGWTIVNRTQVTGNTNANQNAIGSGLMAWTKVSGTVDYVFGAVAGQQFPNLAFGAVVRITGQDLSDPVLGTSVNTFASGSNGFIETGGFERSYDLDAGLDDSVEIMLCMGGQEVTWSDQDYVQQGNFDINLYTEILESTSTSGADGSIAVAYIQNVGGLYTTSDSYSATTSAINARHSLMVASFGGPRPSATGYSFSSFF